MAIIIMVVLAAIAVPSYKNLGAGSALRGAASELVAAVCTDSCITCPAHGSVSGSIMTAGSKIGGK